MDLAQRVPESAQLVGCDASAINFPKEVPGNVRLLTSSVTRLPEEWTNTFTFINQRFLLLALSASDWPLALSEHYRVLRPGGHTQLIEMDFAAGATNEGPKTRCFLSFLQELMEKRGLIRNCSSCLSQMVKDVGFVDIRVERKYLPLGKAWGKIGKMGRDNFKQGGYNIIPAMIKAKIAESEETLSKMVDEAVEEWDNAEYGMQYVGHIVCARKPELPWV